MASYGKYEHVGRRECPWCRQDTREEWRIIDVSTGHTIGRRIVRWDCSCVPLERWEPPREEEVFYTD
jgi:hypothetical protein